MIKHFSYYLSFVLIGLLNTFIINEGFAQTCSDGIMNQDETGIDCGGVCLACGVTVNSNPTPTITPGGPTTFCTGGSVTLSSNAATSYLWSTTETTQNITVSAGGTYTVTVTDGNGCTGTDNEVVTVNTNPTPTITPGGPTTFCAGGSVILSSSAASSYSWSTLETTQNIIVTGSGTYTVTVTDGNGCTGTDNEVVTVNANPTPTITPGGPTTFCAGGSVTLSSSAASSYSWNTTETTQNITVSASGTYTVTVTDGNGCTGTDNEVVTVNANSTISETHNNVSCPGGNDASINITVVGGTPSYTYSWNDGPVSEDRSGLTAGTYTVTVTDASGCTATMAITITQPAAMSGAYTIGGVSPDYATFTLAVADLTCRGVSGAVVFNVRDGTYTEQITCPSITGASVVNTITFQSENNDSSLVTLSFSSALANNFTIKLVNADYITFRKITLRATNNSYGRVADIDGGASFNKILNCRIIGVPASVPWDTLALIYSSSGDDENNQFTNNLFLNGSRAFYYSGTSLANLEAGTVISENIFSEQYNSSIHLELQDAPVISFNDISTTLSSLWNYSGVLLKYCDNGLQVTGNKINAGAADGYGIFLWLCDGITGTEGLVSNNFIRIGATNQSDGSIYLENSTYQNVYHNSINITSVDLSSIGLHTMGGGNINIQNNIIVNSGGGYSIAIDNATGINTLDNNNLFISGVTLGRWEWTDFATLTAWQAASGKDANSVSGNPLFVSASDLHLTSCSPILLKNGANLTAVVPDDIDGEARTATPWMGGDETSFTPLTVSETHTDESCPAANDGSINVTVAGGSPFYTFVWNDGPVTEDRATLTAGNYSVTVTDASSCTAGISVIITQPSNKWAVTSAVNGITTDGVSLRWAITQANITCGHDTIIFNLGAGGPFTISLTSALPDLTDNAGATINGWDNSGNDGTPNSVPVFSATAINPMNPNYKIILGNGNNVPTGLVLVSDSNVVQGLVLQDFGDGTVSNNDIAITISGNDNKILGCYIGIDPTGTTRGTKTATGVAVSGANNQIGDGTALGANLISGMNGNYYGVYFNGIASGNSVKGNMIGLQKDGSTLVLGAMQQGIFITGSAGSNTIGGSNAGKGNVISGNNGYGIYTNSSAVSGNNILGNILGPQANGTTLVNSNPQQDGIYINNSPNNVIGGSSSWERNIISANQFAGILVQNPGAYGNVIKGNYIGTDITGTLIIANSSQDLGIDFETSAVNNTVGGTGIGEGNLISGNTNSGIRLLTVEPSGNTILGNIIGTQADGISYLALNAQSYGININGSSNNMIGGNTSAARNIISGNETSGIFIITSTSTGNVVQGNYIGIAQNGTSFITGSTQDVGVYLVSSPSGNTIGGAGPGEGNLISGNKDGTSTGRGIYINSIASGNFVLGNIIGPQSDGMTYLASNGQFRGIDINGSPNNIIGGNTAGERNIISANESYGVYISGALSTGNVVKGNYVGPNSGLANVTGSSQDYGVYLLSGAANNTIGGLASGEENKIAFNIADGIYLYNTTTSGNNITRNPIYSNPGKAINLNYGVNQGNNGIAPPTIVTANTALINGASGANDIVEIFKNTTGSGQDATFYVGTDTADGSGNWSLPVSLFPTDFVVATARDAGNNSSELSTQMAVVLFCNITTTVSKTDVTCNSGNDGTATVTTAGGFGSYTYIWSNGGITSSINLLTSSTYTVTITDSLSCTAVDSAIIAEPALIVINFDSLKNVTCNSDSDGYASVALTGGTPPYAYIWSNGDADSIITAVSNGIYQVTVTDGNNCQQTDSIYVGQPGAWSQKDSIGTVGRYYAVGFSIGSKGYIGTGFDGSSYKNDFWEYDPVADAWTQKANFLGFSRTLAVGFSIGNKGYIGTGWNGGYLNDFWEYDPGSNNWLQKANFGGTARNNAVGFSIDTLGYIGTGWDGGYRNDFWEYDPVGNSWAPKADFGGTVRHRAEGFSIGDKGFIGMGNDGAYKKDFWRYNPSDNSWMQRTDFGGTAREDAVSFSIGSRGYVGTGSDGTNKKDFWEYNSNADSWTKIADFSGAVRYAGTGFAIGNKGYAGTGDNLDPGYLNDFWEWDPAAVNALTLTKTDLICFGDSSGTTSATVTGGTSPYTYNWSNGTAMPAISNLPAATYTVTVTDAISCTLTDSLIVTEPSQITTTVISDSASCFGCSDGKASVSASGGLPPYSFTWSTFPVQTNDTAINLTAGNYSVTVSDSLGCSQIDNIVVEQPASTCIPCDLAVPNIVVDLSSVTDSVWSTSGISRNGLCCGASGGDKCIRFVVITNSNTKTLSLNVTAPSPPGGSFFQLDCGAAITLGDPVCITGGISYCMTFCKFGGDIPTYTIIASSANPISVSAGNDTTICAGSDLALSGNSFTSTGQWSTSGTGSFIPADTVLNATYQPGAGDIISGNVSLYLSSTNNGICPAMQDTLLLVINLAPSIDTVIKTDVACQGGNDGAIDLTVTGGVSPYTFNWNEGSTTEDIDSLSASVYMVTVTDALTCTDTLTVTVTEPLGLFMIMNVPVQPCYNECNAWAYAEPGGGTSPYTFNWSNGVNNDTTTGLCAGVFAVTLTDANGCTDIISLNLTALPAITLSETHNNVACNGDSTGTIDLSASGGSGPFSYSWNDGVTTQDRTLLPANSYSVTVTDSTGCDTILTVTITEPAALSTIVTTTPDTCPGAPCEGTASATVSGGVSPYNYLWNAAAQTTSVATGLCAGNYMVSVNDANNCVATANASVTDLNILSTASSGITASNDSICPSDSVMLTVSGGSLGGGAVWNWYTALCSGTSAGTGSSITVSPSSNTTYFVRAEGTCNTTSCASITIYINSQSVAAIAVNALPPTICQGSGSTLSKLGGSLGTGALWQWYTDSCGGAPAGTGTPLFVSPSATTTYYLRAEGACNTTSCRQTTVTVNPNTSVNDTISICSGDSIYLGGSWQAAGGSYVDTFLTVDGCDSIVTTALAVYPNYFVSDSAAICTGDSIFLGGGWQEAGGSFTDTFATVNGCDSIIVTSLTVYPTYNSSATAAICSGDSILLQGNYQTTAGTYYDTLSTVNYCDSVIATTLTVNPSYGTTDPAIAICNGDSVSIYGIFRSITGTYYDTLASVNGCDSVITTILTVNPAYNISDPGVAVCSGNSVLIYGTFQSAAGTYYDSLISVNGCDSIHSTVLTVNQALTVITTKSDVSCFGICDGFGIISVSGGTPPYSYLWGNGSTASAAAALCSGSYTATITDALTCSSVDSITITEPSGIVISVSVINSSCGNSDGSATATASGGNGIFTYIWSDGQSGSDATGLVAGTYTVTATDINGCTGTALALINDINGPTSSLLPNPASCAGVCDADILTGSTTGGTPPYTYSWSDGQTDSSATGLCAGTYYLTISDASGCMYIDSAIITEPAAISVGITATNSTCGNADGSAAATASGGSGSFSYEWSDGQSGSNATGLAAGTYVVTATDASGCTSTANAPVSDIGGPAITLSSISVICSGGADGIASVSASGGTPPYSYLWDDLSAQTDSAATGLSTGTYSVTVTDNTGCKSSGFIMVTEPAAISKTITITDATCGNSDGSATVIAAGGSGSYTYTWNTTPAQTGSTATGLVAGIYSVTVSDSNGCSDSTTAAVAETGCCVLATSVTIVTNNLCYGDTAGTAKVTVASGTPPYTYSWSSPAGNSTDSVISGLQAGNYQVTIMDQFGCTDTLSFTIAGSPAINFTIDSIKNATCYGGTNGAIYVTVTGGTLPYTTFAWFRVSPYQLVGLNEDLSGIIAGWYALGVIDSAGCRDTLYIGTIITQPPPLINSIATTSVPCSNVCTASATVILNSANPTIAYLWNDGQTTQTATGLCMGNYFVTVTDTSGCSEADTAIINSSGIPKPVVLSSLTYCKGDKIDSLKAQPQVGGIIVWYMTPPPLATAIDSGNVFFPSPSIGDNNYYVTEWKSPCESEPAVITLTLHELPLADAGDNRVVCHGEATVLHATGGIMYAWKPTEGLSDPNIDIPVARPADTTVYYVTVTSANNCSSVDSVTVFVDFSGNCWHIYNMFSPNGDGENDAWVIDGIGRYPENKITIYDRFEDKVRVLSNYDNSSVVWSGENKSGEPLPAGTYFYIIDIGVTTYSGWVQIIR